MYRNSVDALRELLPPGAEKHGSGRECHITKLSHDRSQLENGNGDEAIELHKEALKHDRPAPKKEVMLVP